MRLLSVRKWLPSVRKWLLREDYLTVTFAKKFTKKKIIFGNQSGPSDAYEGPLPNNPTPMHTMNYY